ncbi:putative polyketide synthase protein [Botrytis fragariae]|uniref:Putative polyketide synthase protein n=1 Tax=Botrytis fragariae TaxID=1964551 RepID=A0A8H6ELH1_9HELO|nr:putative polyketide synthase protein [Botrytis fragariae]KAF5876661.1 putative polyketide synthase protein [Botrytis fragariae]
MISKVDFVGAVQRCYNQSTVVEVREKLDQSHLNKVSINSWLEIGPHAALQGPIRIRFCYETNSQYIKKINLNDMSWAKDHRINGIILYPAAGVLAMAIEVMKQLDDNSYRGIDFFSKPRMEACFGQ